MPAERSVRGGRASGEQHRDEREREPDDVGEVVAGVRQQAERVGAHADDNLNDNDDQDACVHTPRDGPTS